MTKDQILQIAHDIVGENWVGDETDQCFAMTASEVIAFAQRIRQEALEEAATICDEFMAEDWPSPDCIAIEIRNLMSKGE